MRRRTPLVSILAAVVALAGPAGPSAAQCTYLTLAQGVPQVSAVTPQNFRFGQNTGTFMAVGSRSAAGSNHGMTIYSSSAGPPTCVSGAVAASTLPSGVDLVVGDFRPGRNPSGVRFGQAVRSSGAGSVTLEWEGTAHALAAGAPPDSVRPAPAVLDAFQVFLEGGSNYTLNFAASGADLKLLVFHNPGAGQMWAARGAAQMLATITAPTLFAAPASDDYALVVVNDDGAAGNYTLWVELCQSPDTLASGVAEPAAYPYRTLLPVSDPYWQAVGLRGAPGADWNIAVYDTGRGEPEPVCFAGLLASSSEPSGVDFVVADLSSGPIRPFFARNILASGAAGAMVEWDAGPDEIDVNAASPVVRSTDAGDVLETWDVLMNPGQQYTIEFAPSGAAALRWYLFANPNQGPGGAAWFARSAAVASGTGNASFLAVEDGWHGLVVVNENGGAGGYTLAVRLAAGVDVPAAGAPRTGLGAIVPNPLRGRASIGFTLARPARARIEILDVAGRRVAGRDAGVNPAGAHAVAWDGRDDAGGRLAAGVYFARLFVDEAAVGAARMVLLR